MTLPAHVRAECQRILNAEARRLLAVQLDGDPAGTPAGVNPHHPDDGTNQPAASVKREPVPIRGGVDGDHGAVAA